MTKAAGFELITLRNGERAVRHCGHGEVMHPSIGPWAEANRLYVEQPQLAARLSMPLPEPVGIFDVGLGAAANAVAALTCATQLGSRRRRELRLVSFEIDLAPLRLAMGDAVGFPFLTPFHAALECLLTVGHWQGDGLSWVLLQGDLRERLADTNEHAELIYFDPFSPACDPSLWGRNTFVALRAKCADQALLLTYSAATATRVSLLLGGFYVGAGISIGTKSETTIAATDLALLGEPLGARWLQRWERSSARAPHGEAFGPSVDQNVREHPQWEAMGTSPLVTG